MAALVTTPIKQRYLQLCQTQSDIQHHLPLLYSLAQGNVLELGTRTGVSTAALLAGVETRGGHVWSVDTDDCSKLFEGHPQWTFVRGDSRDSELAGMVRAATGVPVSPVDIWCLDILLVDTEHTYENVTAELTLWASYIKPGGSILLHDPETFPGVRRAIMDFCAARGWPVTFVLPCNGMAVIEVPG